MSISRTKVVGYLLVLIAIANTAKDALDGGGFNFSAHLTDVAQALAGAGLVFLRDAIAKIG